MIASRYETWPRKNTPRKKILPEILGSVYNITNAKCYRLLRYSSDFTVL